MSDVRLIYVDGVKVGIVGLDQALEELADSHAQSPEAEVTEALLARLEKRNYFPPHRRRVYGRALWREFRRHLGLPVKEERPALLEIRVLGQGCPRCQELMARVMRVAAEMNLTADLEHVRDVQGIAALGGETPAGGGGAAAPALLVGGELVSQGKVLSEGEIRQILQAATGG